MLPGFEPRFCYGDLVLSFVYRPTESNKGQIIPPTAALSTQVPAAGATTGATLQSWTKITNGASAGAVGGMAESDSPTHAIKCKQVQATCKTVTKRAHDFILTHFTNVRQCELCRKKVIQLQFNQRHSS